MERTCPPHQGGRTSGGLRPLGVLKRSVPSSGVLQRSNRRRSRAVAGDAIVGCPVLWLPGPWFRVSVMGSRMVLPAVQYDLRDQLGVIRWSHFGELLDKGDRRPKL